MKVQPAVRQESIKILIGCSVLSILMVVVFCLLGQFDYTVILGAIWGTLAASGNFFLMALSVQRAAETMNGVSMPSYEEKDAQEAQNDQHKEKPANDISAEVPEIRQAKRRMQASYTGRMILLGAAAILAIVLPFLHSVAALVPLMFPQLVVMANKLIIQKGA